MAQEERIDSTQRLLEYIRNKGEAPLEAREAEPPRSGPAAPAGAGPESEASARPGGKGARALLPGTVDVGVELGPDYIRLLSYSTKRGAVLDAREAFFSASFGQEGHRRELGQALESFLSGTGKVRLWAVAPFLRASVHSITIPKVGSREVPNTVYWTLKRETDFDEDEYVLDYEIQSGFTEKGIAKKRVLACLMYRRDVEAVSGIFRELGRPLSGLTLPSVALQHFFVQHERPRQQDVFALLHLGRDGARTAVYEQGLLRLCREVRPSLDRMVEECMSELEDGDTAAGSSRESGAEDQAEDAPKRTSAKDRLLTLFADGDSGEDPASDRIFDCIQSSVERLEGQVERTFAYFTRNMGGDPVQKIFFSGEMLLAAKIKRHIRQELNLPAQNLDVFGSRNSAADTPTCPRTSLARCKFLLPFVLSRTQGERSLNFVQTYRDKAARKLRGRLNAGLIAAAACCALLAGGFHFVQQQKLTGLRAKTQELQTRLESYNPDLDRQQVLQLASSYKKRQRRIGKQADRFYPVGLLSDLLGRTPSGIRLLSLAGTGSGEAASPGAQEFDSLRIEGAVLAGEDKADSLLASYIMSLRASAFLAKPTVRERKIEPLARYGRTVRFTLSVRCKRPRPANGASEKGS